MRTKQRVAFSRLLIATGTLLGFATASFAQVQLKVIVSGGFTAPYREALPLFEQTSGIAVTTTGGASQGSAPNTIGNQLKRGVPLDVIILAKEGLADVIADGKIKAGTNIDLAQTPMGVSVRAGAPKPDISSVAAFKEAMLRAKSVTFPFSTTGIWLKEKLFPELGIADQMADKISSAGAAAVGEGRAEIAVEPVSELLHVQGTDFVGTIPKEIQYISVFSAAVVGYSQQKEAAKQLIAFFSSGKADAAIKNAGMQPLGSR